MSGLKERLERLRAAAIATEVAEVAAVESYALVEEDTSNKVIDSDDNGQLAFQRMGVEIHENEWGSFLLRTIRYPLPHRHGRYALEDLKPYVTYLDAVAARQNTEAVPIDLQRMLFLDTETTGLGVGTGNVPFMIGIGYYTDQAFIVEQTLIRHPGEEKAMLHYLLDHLKRTTHLVTYNGRTFDWPVIVNRYIMNGWRSNGVEPAQLDFLHPSRALWRNTLTSCRLSMVEKARLGVKREDDVPGSLAPVLYIQYLNDGDASHLRGVYAHNEQDVLSLASLSVHFAYLLSEEEQKLEEVEGEELYRTACWLEKHGNGEQAERLFNRLLERDILPQEQWGLALAARYKKLGKFNQAIGLWQQCAKLTEQAFVPKVDAHIELAIYYEHRSKELLTALNYVDSALSLLQRMASVSRVSNRLTEQKAALIHRAERLKNKISRQTSCNDDNVGERD
ncbi:MAG: ribonuclease H-like domain-containing protein [Candidatus Cohnella colombiensis]|uniref:Ribonuclease H-like domain-containing protein n=1 Tax=Candidatus Cohnella colombiensis TaxID=3121368 RepID=A0AA95JD13_9BACL|nr:MAG: ribonuclease H-like domain-containing protein [Cohnella sp.]